MFESIEEMMMSEEITEGREYVDGENIRVLRISVPHPNYREPNITSGYVIREGDTEPESVRREMVELDLWHHYQVAAAGGKSAYDAKMESWWLDKLAKEAAYIEKS